MFNDVRQSCQRLSWIAAMPLALLVGCSKAPDTELPLSEPTVSDRPDARSIELYRAASQSVSSENAPVTNSWPQLFGPDRTSVVPAEKVNLAWPSKGPPERWSIPCGTGYGSPVVDRNRVVMNHRIEDLEIVQCVDAADGTTIWQHTYPTTFHCEYEYTSGPLSTPVIHQGRVYAVGGQGQFFCLDLADGHVLWARNLHEEFGLEDDMFAVGSTPLVHDEQIIFNLGASQQDAGIIALRADSGETIWTASDHEAAYCSPFVASIHDQPFLFVITRFGLVSMDPRSGAIDWTVQHRSRAPMSFNAVSPMVSGDLVLAVTGPGPGAICLRILPDRSYEEAWRDRRVIDSQYTTLMAFDHTLYGFTSAGQGGAELRCIDFRNGDLRWKYHSILRRGQGLVVGNAMIVLGERGHLASLMLGESEPSVLAFTDRPLMQEPCYCSPAFARSCLYLKDETRLACFDLSP